MPADLPLPPLELINRLSGPGTVDSYWAVVRLLRPFLLHPGGVKPADRVLEVGSGIGRMAHALADHVTPPGSYDGLEVAADGVQWCAAHISPRLPHFRFHHADVYNGMYNPAGGVRADRFRFPFPDAAFDFAFLTSVFTHLLPADTAHYLGELARVLKPGGRLFATFFLIHPGRLDRVRAGAGVGLFRHLHRLDGPPLPAGREPGYGDCFVDNPAVPEGAVGYDPRWLADHLRGCGFTADATTYYGDWCGQPTEWDGQDIICATKTSRPTIGYRLKKLFGLGGKRAKG